MTFSLTRLHTSAPASQIKTNARVVYLIKLEEKNKIKTKNTEQRV